MTQWVDCDTRFSGRDKQPRLDLLFTKEWKLLKLYIETIHYDSPLGKSDYVLMEFKLKNENVINDENYKVERFEYSKADFEKLRKYFVAMDWKNSEEAEDVWKKWERFIRIYNSAMEKFVLEEEQDVERVKNGSIQNTKRLEIVN